MLLSRQSDIRRMLAKCSPALLASVAIINAPQTSWAQTSVTQPPLSSHQPIYLALGAFVVTFFLVLVWAKKLRKTTPAVASAVSMTTPVPAYNPESSPKPAPRVEMKKDRPIAALKPRNGVPATSLKLKGGAVKNANGQRKRSFDYNRYFTDLMSSVYSQTFSVENTPVNGRFTEAPAPHANGNGHSPSAGFTGVDLIASQKSLIEEQRRLIQEQSKLIEEKTRLIAEKNHVLKIQSEFIDNKVL